MSGLLIFIAILEAIVILALVAKDFRTRYDGAMIVYDTDKKKTFSLEINTDPDTLDQKKRIVLKVTSTPT